jgi:hypothetical protein
MAVVPIAMQHSSSTIAALVFVHPFTACSSAISPFTGKKVYI